MLEINKMCYHRCVYKDGDKNQKEVCMLQVFDAENCRADIVDIDAAFSKLEIVVNDAVKNIIKAVDAGNMIDGSTFEDRFGVRLYLSELSTGCKAAICVALMPDQMIDLQECGLNARDAIFNYCEDGKKLLRFR